MIDKNIPCGTKVRCIRSGTILKVGTIYRVCVVVENARTAYQEQRLGAAAPRETGIIVWPEGEEPITYPFVWDFNRFELVEENL